MKKYFPLLVVIFGLLILVVSGLRLINVTTSDNLASFSLTQSAHADEAPVDAKGKVDTEEAIVNTDKVDADKNDDNEKKNNINKELETAIKEFEPIVFNIKNSLINFPKSISKKSSIGINTNEVYEQDASIPFIDLFRVSAPFHENIRCRAKDKPCLTSASVEYDKQGWPKKLNGGKAGVYFIRNVHRDAFPEGEYTVLYDGEGEIEYQKNAELVSRKPGEDTIKLTARSDGFMTATLQIVKSNLEKPLRKVRVLMPGGICSNDPFTHVTAASDCKESLYLDYKTHHANIIFNPDYLNFLKDFSVLRFMPMSGVTRNPAVNWDQRPKMDNATWGGIYGRRGAPLEIQVELANRLQADPWLNVPHAANDDYMKQFAQYVKDNLSPDLRPHIEYTNEAWNSNFVHNEHMQKMGIAEKLDQDALMAGYKYYSKRSVEFFKIWEDIYGGHEKLVRIISGWDTRPDISGIILAYEDTYKHADALAIAPYVGGNLRGFRNSKTVDEIFHLLTDEKSYRSLPKVIEEIKKTAELTKEFGVSLISYEGGQGLVDWATRDYLQHPNPLFFGANRDSRMADLYKELYDEWKAMGADLFIAFGSPRSCNADGCWGLKEHIRKPLKESPKLEATKNFISANDRWWDWDEYKKQEKPESSTVERYMPKIDPNKPRIVIRPAKEKHQHRLENPQSLHILLEGETWDKRDISGKWQVKWDEENLYLIAKVYDKEFMSDSDDPKQDDSVEFFIDVDNSSGDAYDEKDDFHFIFRRVSLNKSNKFDGTERVKSGLVGIAGIENPKETPVELPYEIKSKYDGYEISATIKWKDLGATPAVKNKLRMDVVINDDDDGDDRDARLSWNSRELEPKPKDLGMILMSGR